MSDELYDKTEALLKNLTAANRNSVRTAAIKGQSIEAPKIPGKLPDVKPPRIKGPSIPKISTTLPKPKGLPTSPEKAAEMIKVPGGLPPPEKPKDPDAVAEQAKNAANMKKLVAPRALAQSEEEKKEVLKVEKNGQWSLEEAALDQNPVAAKQLK